MAALDGNGRANQRKRTRKDLLDAAARLIERGSRPTIEEVAAEALVSRATAYRYFPSVEGLIAEAALDVAVPAAGELFGAGAPSDPVERVARVDAVLDDLMLSNEPALRVMLINSLEQGLKGDGADPARQNRRTPLLEAALEPIRSELDGKAFDRLVKALAMVVGTEAIIVFKDVLQVGDEEARAVKGWTIKALIETARRRL